MFNNLILQQLIESSGKSSTEFCNAVFGAKQRRTLKYFSGRNNISFNLAEKIADYFGVSMETLRTSPRPAHRNIIGNNNHNIGNVSINGNMSMEIAMLQDKVDMLNENIKSKDQTIEALQQLIHTLKTSRAGNAFSKEE